MPVFSFNLAEPHFGSCDNCREGNSDSPIRVWAVDEDGEAPWNCEACYGQSRDEPPPGVFVPFEEPDSNRTPAVSQSEVYNFATDYEVRDSPLRLPVLEDRSARLISFEQELGDGGYVVAQRLYNAGMAETPHVRPYHSRESGGFVHVEEDGSVESEVVYSRVRLDALEGASRFESALNVVRGAIKDGEASLDARCGGHIHVDIGSAALEGSQRYGMADVESLYHLWNHLEDVIYRLGSANWSTHRTIIAPSDYATRMSKTLASNGRGRFGRSLDGARGVLNFSNYLSARGECRCGAFTFEDWSSCRCELPKATVEFRVFNATANLRKVHAYTALSLALVEYAKRHTVTAETHPVNGWSGTKDIASDTNDMEGATEALRFILWELPLTHEERQDIRYCAENSSLADVLATLPLQRRPRRNRQVANA